LLVKFFSGIVTFIGNIFYDSKLSLLLLDILFSIFSIFCSNVIH